MDSGSDRLKRREVERELAEKMRAAYSRYLTARAEFMRLVEQSGSGVLGSDSSVLSHRLQATLQRQNEELREYQAALERFTAFVIRGSAPDSPSSEDGGEKEK